MTLQLDARQRAMLVEMGLPDFFPDRHQDESAPAVVTQAAAVEPIEIERAPPALVRAEVVVQPVSRRAPSPVPAQDRGVESLEWDALAEAVAVCRACGLGASRRNAVFGVGDLQPDVMVIGEPPDDNEDRSGESFGGPAGQLLDNMLRSIGVSRDNKAFIANVLKCRPPGGRRPMAEEFAQCEPLLRRQVLLLKPRVILVMGRFAVETVLQTDEPLGRLRGRVHAYGGVPVVATYHPTYLLGNLADKAKAWADLCLARELMKPPAA
ncbi:uracil-DNA glycosylase family protein [Caenimonas sp. SL110]|uniref:uracil-DNA glycosylase n=1 Tax=Caenimonas sp. SL110 TaxID=1450524 RepID=UPI0006548609|nr:uracil-DNA glycosylase [Caenimonas sp. SL110]